MEEKRWCFPNENDTCRIQKLYYDVNINTIFNRTKLRNLKKKFVKYVKFITKFKQNIVDPEIHTYQKIQDDAYQTTKEVESRDANASFTREDAYYSQAAFSIYNDAKDDCDKVKYYSLYWADSIEHIYNKINEIKTHQKKLKHYKKCSHCEKKDMVTLCACKSKHKLCYDCIYDKTECPVCNEDLGLVHCDICMEYKKELVDTGCKNKHQTCKDCLDKIQKNKKRRGLDHNIRNGYHRDSEPYYFKYKCPFCRDKVNYECGRAEYYHNYDDNDYGNADYESDEEFWRRDEENDSDARREIEEV